MTRTQPPRAHLALLLALLVAMGLAACGSPSHSTDGTARDADRVRAAELYGLHCGVCHGPRGAGEGPAQPWLFPPARDFTSGRFRLVSAPLGGPSEADLVAVLRRGMPGSAMPSFDWLPSGDLELLARYVRELAVTGLAERLADNAALVLEPLSPQAARRAAESRLAPREPVFIPEEVTVDGAGFERGRQLFAQNCAPCHGENGQAEDLAPHWTDEGDFVWARDFTAGVLKGGAGHADIARRVLVGLPGTSMPATALESEADLQALVAYVRALIPEGARDRLVQRRTRLRAVRVPDAAAAGGWEGVPETALVLAPMQWDATRVLGLHVRARQDDEHLAVRLSWQDPERDVGERSTGAAVDAVAVAFSAEDAPPLFGMGAPGHPLELWHWRADLWTDRAGALDLAMGTPHLLGEPLFGESRADVAPRYLPALRADAPTDEVRGIRALGEQDLRPDARGVSAAAEWSAGTWTVVLVGPRGAAGETSGDVLQVAFALWNAAPRGNLASKAITLWHELTLE